MKKIEYQGTKLFEPVKLKYNREEILYSKGEVSYKENPDWFIEETLKPYLPDESLKKAVGLTLILQRPLILRGEPGCGKTQLAKAVAYELYGEEYHKYYFEWHIKSTSKAQDGLYTYHHIDKLRDAQEGKQKDSTSYRELGELGKSFIASTTDKPAILLIDEIDKANIDFPNDLLLELDQLKFKIRETGELIKAKYPPIIFITSNDEKELPAAFLRRCLFHYIEFPSDDKLKNIISANFPKLAEIKDDVIEAALNRFSKLRRDIQNDPNSDRTPSTSELLDWVKVINHYFSIDESLENINSESLPYHQVLLKSLNDYKRELNKDKE